MGQIAVLYDTVIYLKYMVKLTYKWLYFGHHHPDGLLFVRGLILHGTATGNTQIVLHCNEYSILNDDIIKTMQQRISSLGRKSTTLS